MAEKVQIDYEEMENIASKLSDERDALQNVYSSGKAAYDQLKGKWASPAATNFFSATGDMLDRFEKLSQAAKDLVDTAHTVATTLREVEEDAKSQFTWLKEL